MKGVHLGIIASILISMSTVLMKIALSGGFSIFPFLLAGVCGFSGMVLLQVALKKEKSVIIMPLASSLAVLIPSLIGMALLGEAFNTLKLGSIILIIIGGILVS